MANQFSQHFLTASTTNLSMTRTCTIWMHAEQRTIACLWRCRSINQTSCFLAAGATTINLRETQLCLGMHGLRTTGPPPGLPDQSTSECCIAMHAYSPVKTYQSTQLTIGIFFLLLTTCAQKYNRVEQHQLCMRCLSARSHYNNNC